MTSLTSYGTAGQQPNTYKNVHDEGLIDGIRGHHALPKDAAKRITAAKVGLKHLQVKRRRPTKGIMVDRKNITEIVTLEDLQAPEGRLWIPAAIVGPVNTGSSEPLYNVLVSYCQLDMKAYHETPWMFAMGTFHQRQSGCYDDKSLVRAYRLSALKVRFLQISLSGHGGHLFTFSFQLLFSYSDGFSFLTSARVALLLLRWLLSCSS